MKEKRPSHSKIKSLKTLKTLKTLSMLEFDKDKSESFCLRTDRPIFSFTVENYYRYTECNGHSFNKIYIDLFDQPKSKSCFFKKQLAKNLIHPLSPPPLRFFKELIGSLLTYVMKLKRLNEMENEDKGRKRIALKANEDDQTTHQTMKMRLMMMRKWP
ncbi:hypothetical protein M9H77_22776 [Catharanthus roseus]|uniref:Uncharacterized protein n=1 Tax=Catharanthus roseus TaxID=4058 RepID=A0ACC0AU30_CATRO|nr:hypothetical protein M9H77_22776 [Catharanthus roseus]